MNDVAPLVQMKLPSANDVMLRINDVGLRPMMLRFAQMESYILHHNKKTIDFQGLFMFLGVKGTPHSPLHLFVNLMGLNLRLQPRVEELKPMIYCMNVFYVV